MTEFQARLAIAAISALAGAFIAYCISKDIQILPAVVAIGVGVAVFGIRMARKTAKQEATLKFIHKYNDSLEVSKGIRAIRDFKAEIENFKADNSEAVIKEFVKDRAKELIEPDDRRNSEKWETRENILIVLNKFEILAIGLKRKIYDQEMVKDFLGRDVAEFYKRSEPIIAHIRKTDKRAFVEFEEIAEQVKKSGDYVAG